MVISMSDAISHPASSRNTNRSRTGANPPVRPRLLAGWPSLRVQGAAVISIAYGSRLASSPAPLRASTSCALEISPLAVNATPTAFCCG